MNYFSFYYNDIDLSNSKICSFIIHDLSYTSSINYMSINHNNVFMLTYILGNGISIEDYINIVDYKKTTKDHYVASFDIDVDKLLVSFKETLYKSPIKSKLQSLFSDIEDQFDVNSIIEDLLEELYFFLTNDIDITLYGLLIDKYRFEHRPFIDQLEPILHQKELNILNTIYNEIEPYYTNSKKYHINDDLYQQYKNYDLYTRNKEIEMHIDSLVDIIKKSKNPLDTKNSIIDDIKYKCFDL